jgi:hypothetical protein
MSDAPGCTRARSGHSVSGAVDGDTIATLRDRLLPLPGGDDHP